MLKKLPPFTRNFYFIATLVFLFWMIFIDSNDFVSQYQLNNKLKTLEDQKEFYIEKIDEVRKDREELLSNSGMLEKFAREKYFMKKETEDVFVIVEEED
ncbi:MAG: septum formation initiator family protein [Cyclobacteriaceae bacterium]